MNKGILYVVGMGPGHQEAMTFEAFEALKEAEVIVGYSKYVALLPETLKNKELYDTGMKKEVERCQLAVDLAQKGQKVAIVSSGDAGVYAMAGLCLEIAAKRNLEDLIQVFPGVSAAQAAAARLGAPLMHDTAYISLSDLMTPWALIEKRIRLASEADFVLALYNPRSKGREDYLRRAFQIMGQFKKPDTPVGFVKNAYRKEEAIVIQKLKDADDTWADMFTVVLVGNNQSYIWANKIITPRGYSL